LRAAASFTLSDLIFSYIATTYGCPDFAFSTIAAESMRILSAAFPIVLFAINVNYTFSSYRILFFKKNMKGPKYAPIDNSES